MTAGARAAQRILVLRALGLGDFVTGLPALRLLRDSRPDACIVLAAPAALRPLIALAGTVDEVTQAHELEPIAPPGGGPVDLAIDLHGNGPGSRRLLEALRPGRVIAFAGSATAWLPDQHETERWCRLLREQLPATGATPPLPGLLGPPPVDTTAERRTVVHCGAKSGSRRWPPQRFAAVALLLAEQGHDVVVSGGPGEEQLAEHIAAAADVPVVTGRDLGGLLALIGGARLVISGDTGVAHLAAVYSVPSVTLFGPVSPHRWGPPDDSRHQVLWHGDGRGDPHGADPDPALLQISVDEVVRATGRALSADTPALGAGVA